jgi:two-component system sensor kinase FixL
MSDQRQEPLSPIVIGAYLILYVALDFLSSSNELAPVGVYPWNPPPALSVVITFFYGWKALPLLFCAAFASDVLVRDLPMTLGPTLLADAAISSCYALTGIILRHSKMDPGLTRQRDVSLLMGSGVVASFLCGLAVISIFVWADALDRDRFLMGLFRWWVGDAVGISVTAPLLLLAISGRWNRKRMGKIRPTFELAAQGAAMMASIMVVFRFDLTMEFRILYPLFIPMIWIAVRYGFEGAAISALVMQLALAAASGLGFRDDEMVTQLQFAMLAFTITAASVGAVVGERRVKSQKLRAKEQKLRWLFEMAPVGLVEVDPRLRIEAVNPTAAEMIGLPIADALGRSFTEFTETFPPPDGRSDLRIHGLTGIRWVEVTTSLADDNDGSQTTIIALRDISERRDSELRRQIRRSEIQRVDRLNAAGELASAMAHELNQPLASIVYYSRASQRLLSTADGVAEARDTLGKAVAQAMRASDIIRNMREFLARGEAQVTAFDAREVIGEVGDSLRPDLERLQIDLILDLPTSPVMVSADRTQVDQVLVNLLRNAMEAVEKRPAAGDALLTGACLFVEGRFARIEIWDNGKGIPTEIEADLFRPFRTSKTGGMGLGLAICKSALDAMGGEIRLAATGADGTTFVVLLPLADQEV